MSIEENKNDSEKPQGAIQPVGETQSMMEDVQDSEESHSAMQEPEIIEKIMEDAPPSLRRSIGMAMMGISSSGPMPHPLFNKFNDEHIHKFLDYAQKDDENNFKARCSNRWFHLLYTLIGVGVFIFLFIYLLPADKDILIDVLKLIVAFVGGVGSGFGLKGFLDKKG